MNPCLVDFQGRNHVPFWFSSIPSEKGELQSAADPQLSSDWNVSVHTSLAHPPSMGPSLSSAWLETKYSHLLLRLTEGVVHSTQPM